MDSLTTDYTRESSTPEGQAATLTTTMRAPGDGPFPNQRTVSRSFLVPLPKGLAPAELEAREARFLVDLDAALQRFHGEEAMPPGLLLSAGVQVKLEAAAGVRMDAPAPAAGAAPLTFESTFQLSLPSGMDVQAALLVGRRLSEGVQALVTRAEREAFATTPNVGAA